MKRFVLAASAAALAALAFTAPAKAGGVYVDDGYGQHHARRHTWRDGRHREWDHAVAAGTLAVTPSYGAEPAYYPGTGGGSPNAWSFGRRASRLQLVEYREPYIARGLLYNVPTAFSRSSALISARY